MFDELENEKELSLISYYQSKYISMKDRILLFRKNEANLDLFNLEKDLDNLYLEKKDIDNSILNNQVYIDLKESNASSDELNKLFDNLRTVSLEELEVKIAEIKSLIKNKSRFVGDLDDTFKNNEQKDLLKIKDLIEYHQLKGDDNEVIMSMLDNYLKEKEEYLLSLDTLYNRKNLLMNRLEELKIELNKYSHTISKLNKLKDDLPIFNETLRQSKISIDEINNYLKDTESIIHSNKAYLNLSNEYASLQDELSKSKESLFQLEKEYNDCYKEKANRSLYANSSEKMQQLNDALDDIKQRRSHVIDNEKLIKEKINALSLTSEYDNLMQILEEREKIKTNLPKLLLSYKDLQDLLSKIEDSISYLEDEVLKAKDIKVEIQEITYELNNQQ